MLISLALAAAPPSARAEGNPADDPAGEFVCDSAAPINVESACDPAWELPDPEQTTEQVKAQVGDRYAGTWIDRTDPAVPRLAFRIIEITEADLVFLATLDPGRDVLGVNALFTQLELTAVADLLIEALTSDETEVAIDADEASGLVTVEVVNGRQNQVRRDVPGLLRRSENGRVKAALARLDRARAPMSALVRVGEQGKAAPFADTRTTYPKHNGGLELILRNITSGASSRCTSGWSVVSDNGTRMGLTAGHCASGYLTENISIGGDHLSRSGQNAWLGASPRPSDAMRYSLASQTHADDNVFVNGESTEYRDANGPAFTQSNLYTGTRVCFQGVSSNNNNCGYVEATDIAKTFTKAGGPTKTINNIWSMRYPVIGGDSGGSVYEVRSDGTARPAGIVTGGTDVMFFSHIGPATNNVATSLYFR